MTHRRLFALVGYALSAHLGWVGACLALDGAHPRYAAFVGVWPAWAWTATLSAAAAMLAAGVTRRLQSGRPVALLMWGSAVAAGAFIAIWMMYGLALGFLQTGSATYLIASALSIGLSTYGRGSNHRGSNRLARR